MSNGQLALKRYYRFHARIYNLTRWSFLFGRGALIREIALRTRPRTILEVGCGTGHQLKRLIRWFPEARITGMDLSAAMLRRARRCVGHHPGLRLIEGAYDRPLSGDRPFDLILFSYTLSMINPGWDRVLEVAERDLGPGGLLAVVDFHETPLTAFSRWMAVNHVRMEGHLLAEIKGRWQPVHLRVRNAYGGLWRYFTFIGRKSEEQQ